MVSKLQICREALEASYKQRLNLSFSDALIELRAGRQPVWRYVSGNDLTSEVRATSSDVAGLVLDPEIGVLAYFLQYSPDSGLQSQVARALALRSRLAIESNYVGGADAITDARGAWRIIIHWLVEPTTKHRWLSQIVELRRETAFSEEIAFEPIFLNEAPFRDQVRDYGFPRLLLVTREVFSKAISDDVSDWLSADARVDAALLSFDQQFKVRQQREFALMVASDARKFRAAGVHAKDEASSSELLTFERVRLKDFRNIRDFAIECGGRSVGSVVIHGPNGTGKTSLCEGISLALFRSSSRYKRFTDTSQEKDISAIDRAAAYLREYLTPLDGQGRDPQIALDDRPLAKPGLAAADRVRELDVAMSGTILTQDTGLEFSRMSSSELAARVLRGYSELADRVSELVEVHANRANDVRQSFLRDLGIPASITRLSTAHERIARREIDRSLPRLPIALVEWLDIVESVVGTPSAGAAQRWRSWGQDEPRSDLARKVGSRTIPMNDRIDAVQRWLEQFNALVRESNELQATVTSRLSSSDQSLEKDLHVLGEWLEARKGGTETPSTSEVAGLREQLKDLESQLAKVLELGQMTAAHVGHLETTEAYIRQSWLKQTTAGCPTCGADHENAGGILPVVESLRARVTAERDAHRVKFRDLKSAIEQVQKTLAKLGESQCPLKPAEQSALISAIQWLIPDGADALEWISVRGKREQIARVIGALSKTPSCPEQLESELQAGRVVESVERQLVEADVIFEAPENWAPIREGLQRTLAAIVMEHLPKTLEKLWLELSYNLTSASWVLPEQPRLDLTLKRRESALSVKVKGRLAKYVLNQAEAHALGLAWFFTSYFTRGRFSHACMVMDDPAQELDQTSFRELCRLLETIVRLHRVYDRPLKLILMFNQESRVIDAARATEATLSVLDWSSTQESSATGSRVIGEGFYAPQPTALFEAADSVVQ